VDEKEVRKILNVCLEARGLTVLLEKLNKSDRTKFKRKYINPLLREGLLEMTNPKKPNSPSQKYVTSASGKELIKKNT
jgi:ATP-dependent DNA helicase RecG